MYDFAHGQCDSIEGITHSLCSLEYEDHRPLYDWFLDELEIYHPRQIEFARLALTYTVMSKRKLLRLVNEGHVRGWDDPRMPTLAGTAPPRLHARVHPDLRGARRRGRQGAGQPGRHPDAGALPAGGAEPDRPAGHGRAAAAARGHRQLPRGPGRGDGRHQQSGGSRAPAPARSPSPRFCTSSRRTFARTRPSSSSDWRPGARCGCASAYFVRCESVVKNEAGRGR